MELFLPMDKLGQGKLILWLVILIIKQKVELFQEQ